MDKKVLPGWVAGCCMMIVAILAICFAWGLCIYLLWNWLVPSIFGLRELTSCWEALGLLMLVRLLVQSFSYTSRGKK